MENTQFTQCIWPRRPVRGDYTHPPCYTYTHCIVPSTYIACIAFLLLCTAEAVFQATVMRGIEAAAYLAVFSHMQLRPRVLAFSAAIVFKSLVRRIWNSAGGIVDEDARIKEGKPLYKLYSTETAF